MPANNPRNTAISPSMLLARILRNANLYSPVFISNIVSSVKEENVVKPPNKPVKRKIRVLTEKFKCSARLQLKPIRKEPIILTESIPTGKECSTEGCIHLETPKRSSVPIAPPVISNRTFIMLSHLLCVFPRAG